MTPWISELPAKWVKYFRFSNTLITVGILAYCAYFGDFFKYPFYMTSWASAFTMFTHLMISASYFKSTYTSNYDYMISSLFEIALPFNFFVSFIYWGLLFRPSAAFDWSDPENYINTFLVHTIPLLSTLLEWSFNRV